MTGVQTCALPIFDVLLRWVGGIPGRINSALGGLPGMLFRAGVHAMESLIDGLLSMVGKLGSVMGSIASKVAGFFGLSPAKEGPLSGGGAPEIRGQHFAQDIAAGMLSRSGAVAAAAQQVAQAAAVTSAGSGGNAVAGGRGGYGGAPVVLQLMPAAGGSGIDALFMKWLQNAVRTQGGDPRMFNRKVAFI